MTNLRTPAGKLPYRMFDNPPAPAGADIISPRTQPRRLKTVRPRPVASPTVGAGSESSNSAILDVEK